MRSHSKDRKLTRILGASLIALALSTGLDPDYPFAQDAIPRVQVPADWERKFPATLAPAGEVGASIDAFSWSWQGEDQSWQVVILDQELNELLRSAHVVARSWTPEPEQRALLTGGDRLYWFVVSDDGPWELRSDLRSFSLR
ncbi:MAG: hypothetical protein ACYTG5_11775 [Planctomycetota bacterium]|jgi:hypothetical protein